MSVPSLCRLPLPRTEPPYDDELPDRVVGHSWVDVAGAVQGTLALAFAPSPESAADRGDCPDAIATLLRLAPPPQAKKRRGKPKDDLDLGDREPVRTGRASLPDPRPWARSFVQALAEALDGFRPTGQLAAFAIPAIAAEVARQAASPLHAPTLRRPVVRSVHVAEPQDGAAEVCAILRYDERCRALALRLEGLDGRWQCTALTVG